MMPRPQAKVDFTLTDTEGEPFEFRARTDGYITLLFFGYTYCPDVCPIHMANIGAVLDDFPLEVRSQIKVVFVTTDPERDSPERLRLWLDNFDASFIGLRGDRDEVNEIQIALGLPASVIEETEGGEYLVGHSARVLAFTKDNLAHVAYPFGTRQADWAHDLPKLVDERWE
jgi:protein SCO1/2